MRVGVNFEDLPMHWQGGINYYNNLFAALSLIGRDSAVAFCGPSKRAALQKAFPTLELVDTNLLEPGHPLNFARRLLRKFTGTDLLLDGFLRRQGVDVLTHSAPLGKRARTPNAAWIPDFQHMHLPHLFTAAELAIRDQGFRRMCTESDAIFVSSEAAAADLAKFDPAAASKCKVLRFCIQPIKVEQLAAEPELRSKYDLPGDYFYIPNQFWPHKNQLNLLKAVQILRRSGRPLPLFVFSGSMEERDKSPHIQAILDFTQQEGLQACVRFLGSIPYKDVLSLANFSMAIINPSLFEGWSTSVEEAKELGKYMLLSNLPVNIEQIQEGAFFFDPTDPASIAQSIEAFLNAPPRPTGPLERLDRISMRGFGDTLAMHLHDIGERHRPLAKRVAS